MANGVGGAAGAGALSGAGMGAQLGSIVPGVGTAVGAVGGAIIGGVAGGLKKKKANESQEIPLVDPIEQKRLAELNQIRKSISSGSDVTTQNRIQEAQNIGRGVQGALSKVTGGDVGSTMDALLKAQKNTQGAVNNAITAGQQTLPVYDSLAGNLSSMISQRKLELQLQKRDQAMAESAQAQTNNNVNANALLATQGGTQTIPEGFSQVGPLVKGLFGGGNQNNPSIPQNIGIPNQGSIGSDAQYIPDLQNDFSSDRTSYL